MSKENTNIDFETQLKDLEQIVGKLENGNLSLDESLELYEMGMDKLKLCTKKLDEAQRKITILIDDQEKEFKDMEIPN